MIDKAAVQDWLDRYVVAWQTYDPAQIGALFTIDVTVRYTPWAEPIQGREAVVASWLDPDYARSGGYSPRITNR